MIHSLQYFHFYENYNIQIELDIKTPKKRNTTDIHHERQISLAIDYIWLQ